MDLHKMQRANVIFDERGIPISAQFDDPYFSLKHGLEETRFVFLEGNRLSSRMADNFHIGEIGFGTGLNFFAAWQLWNSLKQNGKFHYTSFEAFPMSKEDRIKSLAPFSKLAPLIEAFNQGFDGQRFTSENVNLELIIGDANQTLRASYPPIDAWFLDGFSPAKNPEAWSAPLMADIYRHTKIGGTASTYTAAGHVRQKLAQAGFTVSRVQGFGTKRHMTIAAKDRP